MVILPSFLFSLFLKTFHFHVFSFTQEFPFFCMLLFLTPLWLSHCPPPPHVSPSSPSQAVPSKQCIGCGQGDGGAGNRRTRARVTPGPEGIFTPSLRAREIEAAVDITRLWFALYSYPAAMGVQGLIGLIGG